MNSSKENIFSLKASLAYIQSVFHHFFLLPSPAYFERNKRPRTSTKTDLLSLYEPNH